MSGYAGRSGAHEDIVTNTSDPRGTGMVSIPKKPQHVRFGGFQMPNVSYPTNLAASAAEAATCQRADAGLTSTLPSNPLPGGDVSAEQTRSNNSALGSPQGPEVSTSLVLVPTQGGTSPDWESAAHRQPNSGPESQPRDTMLRDATKDRRVSVGGPPGSASSLLASTSVRSTRPSPLALRMPQLCNIAHDCAKRLRQLVQWLDFVSLYAASQPYMCPCMHPRLPHINRPGYISQSRETGSCRQDVMLICSPHLRLITRV